MGDAGTVMEGTALESSIVYRCSSRPLDMALS